MKKFFFSFSCIVALSGAFAATLARAQEVVEAPVGVAVSIRATGLQWNTSGSNGTPELEIRTDDPLNGYQSSAAAPWDGYTPQITARMEPGKSYAVTITATELISMSLEAVPPPGYVMEIEKVAREKVDFSFSSNTQVEIVNVRVLAPLQTYHGRAGTATSLTSGRVLWQAALGSLSNGSSAGTLSLIDIGTGSNWGDIFSPRGFIYEAVSSEVEVVYNPANMPAPNIPLAVRQIIAPEACADIEALEGSRASVKFYHRSQMSGTSGIRSFAGAPFAWYLINEDGAVANKIFINCHLRDQDDLANPEATIVTLKKTVLERAGTAPNFTWTADEWYEGSASIARDTRARASGVESIAVAVPGGATATAASRTYSSVPWGEEITQETVGTSNAVTTTSAYYTDDPQAGNYGRIKSVATTGGGWEAYEYHDYAGGTAEQAGALAKRHRPYKNSSTSVPANLGSHAGEVTTFEYAVDPFGRRTRPSLVETKVNGVTTARSVTAYVEASAAFSGHANLYLVTATRQDSFADGQTLTTVTKFFREDGGIYYGSQTDDFFRMQTHSVRQPDGVKQSYAYQRGSWDGSAFSPSGNGGADYGASSKISVITGKEGAGYTTYNGYNIDDLDLIANKSTCESVIRDQYARVVRTETSVWTGSTWTVVSWVNLGYDWSNQLISRTHSNGAVYTAKYSGEKKLWEQDESGVKVFIDEHDEAGRVRIARREGSGAIPSLSTRYTYDAASRVTQTKVGEGQSETLISSRVYDAAGRLTSETPAGLGTTTISYNPAARSRTITPPNGGARTETSYADGQLASVTGAGVVEEYYDYQIESDGRRYTKVSIGSSSSPRFREAWSDWLGRVTNTSRPGWTGMDAFQEVNTYESGTGRLVKTTRTGYAPTRYGYDDLGRVSRTGLDIGDNGLVLASTDRITDREQTIEEHEGAWWTKVETKVYPFDNIGTAVTVSVERQRLTGYDGSALQSAGVVDETRVTDAEGNTTTKITAVARSARLATVTTSRPGYNSNIEYLENGLATSVTQTDGRVFLTSYDSLLRARTVTDPRTGATTTDYWSGSTLPSSVYTAAGTISSADYDGQGRPTRRGDAGGKNTRYQYNARGQLWRQWGNGAYPVEYAYDSTYGDRTGLSTYRGAPAGDSTSWPSVGTADTTTFTYHPATGLLEKRIDAASQFLEFTYNLRGQAAVRYWARTYGGSRVSATYAYDGNTGEAMGVTYNDTTPSVGYTYTRLGQPKTVTDYTGTRTFGYESATPWRNESVALPAYYGGRFWTNLYVASGQKGRYTGFRLGSTAGSYSDLEQVLDRTSCDCARLNGVTTKYAGNTVSRDFRYTYVPNSALVHTLTVEGHSFSVTRGYEPGRDLLTSIDSKWGTTTRTRYDYTYSNRYLRETAKQSGDAFGDYGQSTYTRYDYNDRGELTDAPAYLGSDVASTAQPLPGRQHEYDYDSIGNRKWANRSGNATLKESFFANDTGTTEGANALNQYRSRENDSVPVQGTVDASSTNVAVAGAASTARQGRYFAAEVAVANASAPWSGSVAAYAAKVGGGSGGADLVRSASLTARLPKALQVFTYDLDGNLQSDGLWDYQWDAENRLVRAATTTVAASVGFPNRVMEYRYDYTGRRVMKRDANVAGSERRYLYDGWNLVAEFTWNASTSTLSLSRSFTWGLDLVGSLSASGGVGALLQIRDESQNKTLLPTYDGNGNVASLLNADTGALEAAYEYDPFGRLLRAEGTYAKENTFRFSTKWHDDETGLVYYGHRYYDPALGRFVNRDPISEEGGLNLYGFARNDGVNRTDFLGFCTVWRWVSRMGNREWVSYTYEDCDFSSLSRPDLISQDGGGGGGPGPQPEQPKKPKQNEAGESGSPKAPNSGVGAPGTLESFIPIWGSGRAAVDDFQNGKWGWGTFNAVMAASDVLLVKTAATMAGKGLWKAGSATWGATRKWLGKQGYAEAGQHVHHGIVAQEVYRGTAWEKVFNQPWNLKPLEPPPGTSMDAWHKMVEGKLPGLNGAERWWYGTPDWFRFTQISVTGDVVNAVGKDGDGKP